MVPDSRESVGQQTGRILYLLLAESGHPLRFDRPGKIVTLHFPAALQLEKLQLFPGLDPLGDQFRPRLLAMAMVALTIAMSLASPGMSRTNSWAILMRSRGKFFR